MRKGLRIVTPLLAALMLTVGQAQAATQTWTYVAAVAVSCGGGECSPQAGGQNLAPLGAFLVTPTGTSMTVKVIDAAGNGVETSLCQENTFGDTDLENVCGDGSDDVSTTLCSTGGNQATSGWKPGNAVLVSVFSLSLTCEGVGSTGTATVTF